jgi:diaminohydroxyphosphoribosylaminopyrimidine deaminase/5-amino-6-(5-phosphoribosylamino)uracil reductase
LVWDEAPGVKNAWVPASGGMSGEAFRDEDFMRRAIAVAAKNLGLTAPNPVVGCVLVKNGAVIAEAATAPGGRPHAEEQALAQAGEGARGAVAYVTLEPCGARSIPGAVSCAERLSQAQVARVVIACEDPSPYASGRGIERLAAAGVPVQLGVLADDAAHLCAAHTAAHR